MQRKEIFAYMSTAKKRLAQMVKDKKEGKEYDLTQHLYIYKTETIIEMLDIQPEYQIHLKTLISEEEHKRRKRERMNAKNREKGIRPMEKYLKERKKNKELLKAEVKLLRAKGLSLRQIAEKLGISHEYVRKLINS